MAAGTIQPSHRIGRGPSDGGKSSEFPSAAPTHVASCSRCVVAAGWIPASASTRGRRSAVLDRAAPQLREGRPRVAPRLVGIAGYNRSHRHGSPDDATIESHKAQARAVLRLLRGGRYWLVRRTGRRACFVLERPRGSRGRSPSDPRAAVKGCPVLPLDRRRALMLALPFRGRCVSILQDGGSAISRGRDRCAFARLRCSWSWWDSGESTRPPMRRP